MSHSTLYMRIVGTTDDHRKDRVTVGWNKEFLYLVSVPPVEMGLLWRQVKQSCLNRTTDLSAAPLPLFLP